MSDETAGNIPRSYQEAIARGFHPVADVGEAVRRITGMSLAEFRSRKERHAHDLVAQVNCLNEPDGTPCDSDCSNGHCILFFCKGGACSHTEALEGDL